MKTRPNTFAIPVLIGLILIPIIVTSSALSQDDESRYLPVETFLIKFTEQIVEMPDPRERVLLKTTPDMVPSGRSAFLSIDPEMVISRFRPDFRDSDTLRVDNAGQLIRRKNWSRVYRIYMSREVDFYEIKKKLEALEYVEWLSPPFKIKPLYTPNDLHGEGNQWNITQVMGEYAWDITQGNPSVRIQIMDDGIAPHHDINNKVTNSGKPFIEDPNIPGFNHGLSVAGVAGAQTDNNLGIASLGWKTMLVDASVADPDPGEDLWDVIVRYFESSYDVLTDYYADIINCSFFTAVCNNWPSCTELRSENIQVIADAVEEALDNGRIIVAAAGNPSPSWLVDSVPFELWPAAYDGVIAVSASNSSDEFPSGYNYGNFVNLSAPAIDILTLTMYNQYDNFDGTSFASPLVAGLVGLMKAVNPSLSPDSVKSILELSADKVGQYSYSNGWNQYMGYGRLNAFRAVRAALPTLEWQYISGNRTLENVRLINENYHEYGTVTIPSGTSVMISDLYFGYGGNYSKISVSGRLIIDEDAHVSNVEITINTGGKLTVHKGATLQGGSGDNLIVEGKVLFLGNSHLNGVDIVVLSSGEVILGDAMQITNSHINIASGGELSMGRVTASFGSGKGIIAYGKLEINGVRFDEAVLKATGSSWSGVHLHGAGSSLKNVKIQQAVNGVTAYNTSGIMFENVQVSGSGFDGIRLINSTLGSGVDPTELRLQSNQRYGIYVDGQYNSNLSQNILKYNSIPINHRVSITRIISGGIRCRSLFRNR